STSGPAAAQSRPGPISVTDTLIAFLLSYLLLVFIKSFWQRIPPGLKRPPGPRGYPLIGNMLDLGKNPHRSLAEMSQKYGDVMQIHLGTRPVVVLSGLETIRQALIKQADDFLARPDLYSFQFIEDGQSLTFGRLSLDVWRANRKLAQTALKAFSSTSLLEDHVSEQADCLIAKFQELMKEKESFEPYQYLVISVLNVICAMCFGKHYNHEDQELLKMLNMNNEFGEASASGNPADFIPILRYLPNKAMKAFQEVNQRFSALVQKIVKEHYLNFDKNNIRDITDSLIDQCQGEGMDVNPNVQQLNRKVTYIVNDLFGAGFDTVTTALSWCLMYLATYPEVQKKIQEEIDQTIGRERKPRLSDRPMLPYTEAFIMEVFRHTTFVPFTIPHCTNRDTTVNGFYIPRDTCVFVNQWQVNHDPKLWKDPCDFSPERFLSADGTGISRNEVEKVLLFGLGKRRCLGENIGKWEIFLFLTTLVQTLEFHVLNRETVDMTPRYGLTMKYKMCEQKSGAGRVGC
uniref:Cytochrome P450 1A n=1 Tax=Varanus komodoensis TaxID=61221 RepID=A0A8D2J5S7_VARKO